MDELIKLLTGEGADYNKAISELRSKRYIEDPDSETYKKQLDPLLHDVFDRVKRPDRLVKIDPEDPEYNSLNVNGNENVESGLRLEKVARVAFALQRLIVKRAVSFLFGNPVELNATPEGEGQEAVLKAIKRALFDAKSKSVNRRVARHLFSATEVAEIWYPVEKLNKTYGFDSKYKLRCAIFSPLLGDKLYPYFDGSGDMIAFSREYSVTVANKTRNYFETYTDKQRFLFELTGDGPVMVDGFPEVIKIGKIPVVFASQPQVEWADVQVLIDRLEKLLSNFADTNDYHASPKIFVKGELKGFAKKGESGAILEGDENSSAEYLSWANAPESVKLEIETLLRMIYTITQTPDVSFDSVKGLNAISGLALKLLFLDAHLKVQDHCEVFDEYIQRRLSIIKSYIAQFNKALAQDAEDLMIEPEIIPYMINDEAAELKIWQDANGGKPIISHKASFQRAGLTSNPEEDYEQYKQEESAANAFMLNEPTE